MIAQPTKCVEFGLRRAQGPNGALTASKYSMLGGFVGTSNIDAGMRYDVPILGTIAHSFIMSYEEEADCADSRMLPPAAGGQPQDLLKMALEYREKLGWKATRLRELYAFVSFAYAYPTEFRALVDSYGTMESGVKNFLCVALSLQDLGYEPKGIRLDSGCLAGLSNQCKDLFKEIGQKFDRDFSKLSIFASNDINENSIRQLQEKNHRIDVFGIGTNLVTCQAQPALGMVYKVCEFKGTPRMKLSDDSEKTSIPGSKNILRAFNEQNQPIFDVLCLNDEKIDFDQPMTVYNRIDGSEHKAHRVEQISSLMFTDGKPTDAHKSYKEQCQHALKQIELFGGK